MPPRLFDAIFPFAFVVVIYATVFLVLWGWVIWDLSLEWRRRVLMERHSKRHNLEVSNHG
jgi:hypothetical protein